MIKLKEEIVNIAERILYFNELEQEGSGLEILTSTKCL